MSYCGAVDPVFLIYLIEHEAVYDVILASRKRSCTENRGVCREHRAVRPVLFLHVTNTPIRRSRGVSDQRPT